MAVGRERAARVGCDEREQGARSRGAGSTSCGPRGRRADPSRSVSHQAGQHRRRAHLRGGTDRLGSSPARVHGDGSGGAQRRAGLHLPRRRGPGRALPRSEAGGLQPRPPRRVRSLLPARHVRAGDGPDPQGSRPPQARVDGVRQRRRPGHGPGDLGAPESPPPERPERGDARTNHAARAPPGRDRCAGARHAGSVRAAPGAARRDTGLHRRATRAGAGAQAARALGRERFARLHRRPAASHRSPRVFADALRRRHGHRPAGAGRDSERLGRGRLPLEGRDLRGGAAAAPAARQTARGNRAAHECLDIYPAPGESVPADEPRAGLYVPQSGGPGSRRPSLCQPLGRLDGDRRIAAHHRDPPGPRADRPGPRWPRFSCPA